MFSNESETLCDCFHKFKQGISFCVTDIHVPIRIATKPKFCFRNFPKFQGTNYSISYKLYIKCLHTSTGKRFLYNNLYDITFTLYKILKLRICLFGNLIKNPCVLIDLKIGKPFLYTLE